MKNTINNYFLKMQNNKLRMYSSFIFNYLYYIDVNKIEKIMINNNKTMKFFNINKFTNFINIIIIF